MNNSFFLLLISPPHLQITTQKKQNCYKVFRIYSHFLPIKLQTFFFTMKLHSFFILLKPQLQLFQVVLLFTTGQKRGGWRETYILMSIYSRVFNNLFHWLVISNCVSFIWHPLTNQICRYELKLNPFYYNPNRKTIGS